MKTVMKMIHYCSMGLLCLLLLVVSCEKGDDGLQGPPGEKGETGVQGIPGLDGKMLRHGNQPPSESDGSEGDFYIDTENNALYGPKTASGWGAPTSLTGIDGKDGSKILRGYGKPSASIGAIGDYYLSTSMVSLYGPKRSTGWGNGISLQGTKGDKGDPGTANVISTDWTAYKVASMNTKKVVIYAYIPRASISRLVANTDANSLYDLINNKNGTLLVYHRNEWDGLFSIPSLQYMGSWDVRSSLSWKLINTKDWENYIIIEVDYISGDEFVSAGMVFGTDKPEFRFVMIPQGAISASASTKFGDDLSGLSYSDAQSLFDFKE